MSNKIKLALTEDIIADVIKDREQHPEAYLYTAAEFKLIYKAREAILGVTDRYHTAINEDYTPDLQARMLAEYAAALKRRRIPVKKLCKLATRATEAHYWSLDLKTIKLFGKYGANPYEIYTVITSTPEEYPPREITPDNCPEYYKTEGIANKAQVLGIPALYLFVSAPELNIITDEEYYRELVKLAGNLPVEWVVVDPSAASFIATIRAHGRFSVRKARNQVLEGIRLVATLLQEEILQFTPECKDTIREFSLYRWEQEGETDRVCKENDHAMDDIRYFCATVLRRQVRRKEE